MHLSSALPILALLASSTVPPGATEAERLVRGLEAHHASLESMSASFTQSFRSAATGQEIEEKGRLFVKRPLLRFDHRKPERKVFLVEADGTVLAYVPADRSAVRSTLSDETPYLSLLRGDGDLLADFSVREVKKQPFVPGSRQLELVPLRPIQDIESVYLEIAEEGLTVHRILVLDSFGNESDMRFEKVKENVRIDDASFRLELPAGVVLRDLGREARP